MRNKIHEPHQDKYYQFQDWQTLTRLLQERQQGQCFRCCKAKNISEITPFRIDNSVTTYVGDEGGRHAEFKRRHREINEFVGLCTVCRQFCVRSDLRNYREIEHSYTFPELGYVEVVPLGEVYQYPDWQQIRNG